MKKTSWVIFTCILMTMIIICSCATPAAGPSQETSPATTPSPAPSPAPMTPPSPTPTPPPQTPSVAPVNYTLKYFTKNEADKSADKFWAFGGGPTDNRLLIYFKLPATPFTIQKITFLGLVIGSDQRDWASRDYTFKIWDKYGGQELWSETRSYTNVGLTYPKWVEHKVPDVKVNSDFTIEFISNTEVETVGYGPQAKIVWKCGLAIGADYSGQGADSTMVSKGVALPWLETWFDKVPKERVGWMIKVEGQGAPQK